MAGTSRRQFIATALAVGAATSLTPRSILASVNDEIRLGFISCGNRAEKLMTQFDEVAGVRVTALCDVDENRLGVAKMRYPKANAYKDLRKLIDDDSVDAVVISTCNHWHCLATIWALESGKDVYVEKPLSHSQWEGKQTVLAARKYGRVCQIGTQQRSDPMQAEIKNFLHNEKGLGAIQHTRVNHYFVRPSIGKGSTPLSMDKSLDYDLWLGPAQDSPIYRTELHYDWHWNWNTGSGEMGNWGVHILDDVRNNVFQDSVALPKRILAGGGRVAFKDAGQTPNVHFAYFDTDSIPVVIALTNLPAKPGTNQRPKHSGPHSGYIAYCEGGRLEGQRGRAVAFDANGKTIKEFKGNQGIVSHQRNFIDAVRAQDRSMLNAEIAVGNDSTGWCNLANVAYRAGRSFSDDVVNQVSLGEWKSVISEMREHLKANQLELDDECIRVSPMLEMDANTGKFVGEFADSANRYLRREYRGGFAVPEIA